MVEEAIKWVKQNWVFSLVIMAFVSTQLLLIAAIWQKPLFWDSSVYIATGKYIYTLGEYGFWSSLRGPGVPLLIGLFWKLGLPTIGFPRLVWMGVSAAGIAVFYVLTYRMYGKTQAIATASIVAASHAYYFFTPEVLTGIPSSIMIFTSLYMAIRERYVPGGILAAAAFLFRYPAALVGLAAVVYIAARGLSERELRQPIIDAFKFSAAFGVVIAPYMVFLHFNHGSMLEPFLRSASSTASVGSQFAALGYYLVEAVKVNPLNLFLPVGLYAVFRERDWKYGGFLSGLAVFYLFFGLFPLKIERYILPFLPLIALFSARGIAEAGERFNITRFRMEQLLAGAFVVIFSFSFMSTYEAYTWENPERDKFFSNVSTLEGDVATNDPRANLYADFRYHPIPPRQGLNILESKGDRIDHWAINGCYWDCRGDQSCVQEVENFEGQLEQKYRKSFELEGGSCNYTIYGR